MKTVSLRERVDQLKGDLLGKLQGGAPLEDLYRRAGELVIEELLKSEVGEALQRDRYERREDQQSGYRNGYKSRQVKMAEGTIDVQVPQVRGLEDWQSVLWPAIKGHSPALQKLAVEMYARGLSTRDIEDLLKELVPEHGDQPVLSRSSVSSITDVLFEEYQQFVKRDLSIYPVVYLFCDGVYESLRQQAGCKQAILVSWAVLLDGSRMLLHLSLGNKESAESWTDHFRSLVSRGMKSPLTITSDGAPGLIKAIDGMWPESSRLRCWFHKMKNVLEKVPEDMHDSIKAILADVRDAPNHQTGQQRAQAFLEGCRKQLPSAAACFEDDLAASLEHLKLPRVHQRCVRTTNLCERSFVEERRRAKVIPKFRSEQECMKLVFATLFRASERWQSVRFTDLEREILRQYIEQQRKLGKQVRDLLAA
jgi:putative transposase